MALSIQQFTSTGTEDHVVLSFPYLQKQDVHLYFDTIEQPFTWASSTRLDFAPAPAGVEIVIKRITTREKLTYLLQEGAPFTRQILDLIHTQLLYLEQEGFEGAINDIYGDVDLHGFRMRNAGDPTQPKDYTTKQWVESQILIAELGGSGLANNLSAQTFEALRRSYAEVGYNVVGTFQAGFTITSASDIGIDLTTGKGYTGPIGPVAAGTNPSSGGFVNRSGALLASKVQYRFSVSATDSGAIADKTTDNTSLIQSLINSNSNCYITIEPNILWHSKLITMKDGVNIIDMSGWDDEYTHWENSVKEFYNTANANTTNGNSRHVISRHHPTVIIDNRGGDSDPEGPERRASIIYRYKGRLAARAGVGITDNDNDYVITNRNLSAMFAFANTDEGDYEIGYGGQRITGVAHAFRSRPENTGSSTIARFYANSGQSMVYQTFVGNIEVRRETVSPDGSYAVTVGGANAGGYTTSGGWMSKVALLSATSLVPTASSTGAVLHNAEITTTSTYLMPVGIVGVFFPIHKVGSGNITINLRSGDTFDDGTTTKTITSSGMKHIVCYAANKWYLV